MPDVTYRLPEWLGSHAVEHITEKHPAGGPANLALMRLVGGTYDGLVVAVLTEDLVEVKPPSIDDPVSLPLNIYCPENDGSLHLETEAGRTFLWVRVRGEHIKHAGGVFDYSDSTLDLQVADLRDLARAAWQRANAIEASS